MFGRATIRLGIGPHSSYLLYPCMAVTAVSSRKVVDSSKVVNTTPAADEVRIIISSPSRLRYCASRHEDADGICLLSYIG